jgi:hypothetical protein
MWAFGTSIDGLGLSPGRWWMLTLADYMLLRKVLDNKREQDFKLWAVERVEFRNAHQMFGDSKVPWTVEDIMGGREARVAQAKAEQIEADMRFKRIQRELSQITKDAAPENLLPKWAKVQWKPEDYPDLFNLKKQ